MRQSSWLLLMLVGLVLAWGTTPAPAQQLAFPTAEGFGRFSKGGRGGKVYNINSLSSAAGSGGTCNEGGCSGGTITLRDCLTDRFGVGARTCIFKVSGVIDFGFCANCMAIPPFLTIAGQTAPGNGIMLRGFELSLYGPDTQPAGSRNAHNVIVRHIRIRNRYYDSASQCNNELITAVFGAHDVIADHISGGWNFRSAYSTAYNTKAVTFQWSLLSEGIQGYPGPGGGQAGCCSPPGATCTSLGGMSTLGTGDTTNGVSYLHNFYAQYGDRIPVNISTLTGQIVNNVLYNTAASGWVMTNTTAGQNQPPIVEYINNYYFHGPQSQGTTNPQIFLGAGLTNQPPTDTLAANSHIYLSGNYHNVLRPTGTEPEGAIAAFSDWGNPAHAVHLKVKPTRPTMMPLIPSTVTALQARADVLAGKVGAYALLPQGLDTIDQRAIRSLQKNTGGVFETRSTATLCSDGECGETGSYPAGTPYVDTDGDGISDAWETDRGLNPTNAADGPQIAANGYSNLENYLNELAGDTPTTSTLLPPQLLVHWRFDEGTGLPTGDATGHGYIGTLMSNPSRRPGLTFNGSTQYVRNGTLQWPAGQPISVALWVKTAGGTMGGAFNVGGSTERAGAHIPWSDNLLYWDYGASLLTGRLSTNFAPYLNSWTHVVLVSNGTNFKAIYINGQLVASATVANAPVNGLTGVEVGRYKVGSGGTAWYTGVIDDFCLYTYVLTSTDIDTLYRSTAQRTATD